MMAEKIKVKVLKTFINKYTKSPHEAGDFLNISEKRFREINSAGRELVRKVETGKEGD